MVRRARGFTLLETLIALSLVSVSLTGLVVAVGSGSKYGALARRQATAVAVARSEAEALSHLAYSDPTIADTVTGNNGDDVFADPSGRFASATVPTGSNAPDFTFAQPVLVGAESYDVFVNVRPLKDPGNGVDTLGTQIAVIVRYKVGAQYNRAVILGYRYNPTLVGVADGLPL
jgi:prepilin-type N-terminal cleavage/methylation domain-containing protein